MKPKKFKTPKTLAERPPTKKDIGKHIYTLDGQERTLVYSEAEGFKEYLGDPFYSYRITCSYLFYWEKPMVIKEKDYLRYLEE